MIRNIISIALITAAFTACSAQSSATLDSSMTAESGAATVVDNPCNEAGIEIGCEFVAFEPMVITPSLATNECGTEADVACTEVDFSEVDVIVVERPVLATAESGSRS